jgi:pSer/pThr/pTyr-binding forkhead associated (FHA) protein
MWRISALDRDGREVGRYELDGGELTIGRDADRQLVLQSASVSRRHARLVIEAGQPCIVDEGSANGVIVDGVRIVQPTYVHAGSRIDLAEFRLAVEPLGQPVAEDYPSAGAAAAAASTGSSAIPAMRLVAEGGPYDGRVFDLVGDELNVGRAVDNDIVLDDPSLSRKHAKLYRRGPAEIEVEDLGSSNGTFVNERKVGRGMVEPGDLIRFGELSFRVDGDVQRSTSSVGVDIPQPQLYALLGGALATLILLLIMIVVLVRKPTPVQASGRDAIARLAKQAAAHLSEGRRLLGEHKFLEARSELDQALELDPANAEARRLRNLAARAPEDEQTERAAAARMALGDRKGLEQAVRLLDDTTEGTPGREKLQGKLVAALVHFGDQQCSARAYADCAWALCKAYEVAPADGRPEAATVRTLRDAERRVALRDKSFARCRAAP